MSIWQRVLTAMLVTAGMVLAIAPTTYAAPLAIVDGTLWNQSSPTERRAYLVGIGNTITVGSLYDEQKMPGEKRTFMRQIAGVIAAYPITLDEAEKRIDIWYRNHPEELAKPVFAILWLEFIKPHLGPVGK